MSQALYDSMIQKISRDGLKYTEKTRTNAITAKAAAVMREAELHGNEISKTQAKLIAEKWYEETRAIESERE